MMNRFNIAGHTKNDQHTYTDHTEYGKHGSKLYLLDMQKQTLKPLKMKLF